MRIQPLAIFRAFILFAFLLISSAVAWAQAPEIRITQAINNADLTTLQGNVHPMARAEFDRGVAPANLPMNRMTLVLRRSAAQEAALAALLDDQQDQSSPNYHKWLTPTQFGEQFGAAPQDIATITAWLESQGFQVNHVANSRMQIEFSGTAGQVQQAFHTAIHRYAAPSVTGTDTSAAAESHWANSSDPQIPTALASVVVGIATLHNFLKSPQHILSTEKFSFERQPGKAPQFTGTSGGQPIHAVGPGDLAVIYNANPLYTASPAINGTGSTIAVVARSNINQQDLTDFKSMFAGTGPQINIVVNGADPGDLGGGEEIEAILDASYSNALAEQAQVDFVVSASTNTADGVDLSEMYIIDNNLGDVMTESFGGCELGVTSGEASSISLLAEEAAAQGITYLVSTGDNGSAGCDDPSSPVAKDGVSVNVLASTPYTVGVGGTMFNEGALSASYWNATNGAGFVSAKSFIPENIWNQSCSVNTCGENANLAAGSGGVSTLFAQPTWQTGVAGIPSPPTKRNLPDVSLTASGHDAYLICIDGGCGNGEFAGVAGTSASVQAFGGIIALVRQKVGARVGQADYVFYKLASKETLASCNGSLAAPVPATNCIFYDTTVGSNSVPGVPATDYNAGVGYDLASGLGSVNITNLVNQWSSATFNPSVTTLSVTPTSFTHGTSATFNITVAPKTGTPSFNSELVALLSSTGAAVTDPLLSSTGTASGMTNDVPGGHTTLTAHYPGNGTLGASDSTAVSVTVAPEPSQILTSVVNSSGSAVSSTTFGTPVTINVTVKGQSGFGIPTAGIVIDDDNLPNSSFILSPAGTATTGPIQLMGGSNTFTVHYVGDSSFLAGDSAPVTVTVAKGPTTSTASASASTIAPGANITLTANIATNTNAAFPTGTVTFFSGSTPVGTAGFLNGNPQNGQDDGSATITTTQLPNGTNSITAQYSGDSNYLASTSSAITVNVTLQADFAVTASPSTVTVTNPGQSASTTLTVAGSNGFSAATTFSCAGLPAKSACVFTPASVTGSGTAMMTVTTTAASLALPVSLQHNHGNLARPALRAIILSFAVFIFGMQLRRRRWNLVRSAAAVVMLAALAACGGGGGGGTTPPVVPGTPTGTQTVTVTATSGTLTHTTTFTLTVN
jgi:Pro-kumamolisin, activation domain/Bacterial Ig-like domain (group 3)